MMVDTGYDNGYVSCRCFWGTQPGSLVIVLEETLRDFVGLRILDAGCGEGKNAVYLARKGAHVMGADISEVALQKRRTLWSNCGDVVWCHEDVRKLDLKPSHFDIVIAYGLLHCMDSSQEIVEFVRRVQIATVIGGYHAICAFNSRSHDLSGHPGMYPTLLSHEVYRDLYSHWDIRLSTDEDLYETHPHNNIPHHHSLTRIIARRTNE